MIKIIGQSKNAIKYNNLIMGIILTPLGIILAIILKEIKLLAISGIGILAFIGAALKYRSLK